ncbi:MAG TPA: ASKHA domain-containing protein [Syntrophorhabdaceae bacterium]|nr:ASKHA domain-containing protein [Syntrophorhabdaceae bacterium]
MQKGYSILFLPIDRKIHLKEGESIVEAALRTGIHINASCGGNGVCGRCLVRVASGTSVSPQTMRIDNREYEDGFRLACQTTFKSDAVVEIPLNSQIDRNILQRAAENFHPIPETQILRKPSGIRLVDKLFLELPAPDAGDNTSDVDRLVRELHRRFSRQDIRLPLESMRRLQKTTRAGDWGITISVIVQDGCMEIIDIQPGNTTHAICYGVAIDVGTTTVCGRLVETEGDNVGAIAEYADYNAQISYGEDVISRIMYAGKEGGLKRLHDELVRTVNNVIEGLIEQVALGRDRISHVVFSGNTTMMHLLFEIDPTHIMRAPYVPATTCFPPVEAKQIGIEVPEHAYAFAFPCVSSYVGGDVVSGVVASRMTEGTGISLFLDIGTNGEIVLGNKEWLLCTSCSAGPAFEGGGIRFGTRASPGAIEKVRVNPAGLEPMILTIGKQKPAGICGSGLIDLAAELFRAGVIDNRARFKQHNTTKRVRAGDDGYEYVLCFAPDTAIGKDIVITEIDLENLVRTKAAIYAGCKVLLDNAGLSFDDLESIIIAGGFGHYIDTGNAHIIGLLPEIEESKFRFVGNASLWGAHMGLTDRKIMLQADKTAKMMTNVELSDNIHFTEEFLAAMFLPHTDQRLFRKVLKNLRSS